MDANAVTPSHVSTTYRSYREKCSVIVGGVTLAGLGRRELVRSTKDRKAEDVFDQRYDVFNSGAAFVRKQLKD